MAVNLSQFQKYNKVSVHFVVFVKYLFLKNQFQLNPDKRSSKPEIMFLQFGWTNLKTSTSLGYNIVMKRHTNKNNTKCSKNMLTLLFSRFNYQIKIELLRSLIK